MTLREGRTIWLANLLVNHLTPIALQEEKEIKSVAECVHGIMAGRTHRFISLLCLLFILVVFKPSSAYTVEDAVSSLILTW